MKGINTYYYERRNQELSKYLATNFNIDTTSIIYSKATTLKSDAIIDINKELTSILIVKLDRIEEKLKNPSLSLGASGFNFDDFIGTVCIQLFGELGYKEIEVDSVVSYLPLVSYDDQLTSPANNIHKCLLTSSNKCIILPDEYSVPYDSYTSGLSIANKIYLVKGNNVKCFIDGVMKFSYDNDALSTSKICLLGGYFAFYGAGITIILEDLPSYLKIMPGAATDIVKYDSNNIIEMSTVAQYYFYSFDISQYVGIHIELTEQNIVKLQNMLIDNEIVCAFHGTITTLNPSNVRGVTIVNGVGSWWRMNVDSYQQLNDYFYTDGSYYYSIFSLGKCSVLGLLSNYDIVTINPFLTLLYEKSGNNIYVLSVIINNNIVVDPYVTLLIDSPRKTNEHIISNSFQYNNGLNYPSGVITTSSNESSILISMFVYYSRFKHKTYTCNATTKIIPTMIINNIYIQEHQNSDYIYVFYETHSLMYCFIRYKINSNDELVLEDTHLFLDPSTYYGSYYTENTNIVYTHISTRDLLLWFYEANEYTAVLTSSSLIHIPSKYYDILDMNPTPMLLIKNNGEPVYLNFVNSEYIYSDNNSLIYTNGTIYYVLELPTGYLKYKFYAKSINKDDTLGFDKTLIASLGITSS
jgi:hypothetical protein